MDKETIAEGGGAGGLFKTIFINKYAGWIVLFLILVGFIVGLGYLTSKALWGNGLGCEDWGGAYFMGWMAFFSGAVLAAIGMYKYMNAKCDSKVVPVTFTEVNKPSNSPYRTDEQPVRIHLRK